MSRDSFIAVAVFTTLLCSCDPTSNQQKQDKVIPYYEQGTVIQDVDKWFKAQRGFGFPDKFQIAHQGREYLVIINCPYSGRAATFSYILEERESGHVFLQKLHHPEGSIAVSVKLEHGALVFKDHNDRSVLWYVLDEGTLNKQRRE